MVGSRERRLRELWLNGNQLSGTIPSGFGELSTLEALYLDGNDLTGCIPPELEDVVDTDATKLGLSHCEA